MTVTDADNASDADTFSVSVTNVAPTVTFTAGPVTVNEGATEHLYSYSISDPGTDTVSSVAVSCGTGGQLVAGSDSNSDTAGSFKCTFPDGPASPTVTVQATDSDNAAGNTASRPVTVTNVAPTVTLTGLDEVVEGSTHTYSFTVSDPGMDTFTLDAGYPTCGLNGTLVAGSLNVTAAGGSFQCTFPDGPASTSVVVKVTDSDGASDTDSEDVLVVAIANVAPTVTAPANQTADEGENKSFNLGSFTDPGPDGPWAVSVDWGDGSTDTTFNQAAPGSLGTASHTYADGPATRTVTVTVTDADNASDAETFSVSVTNVAPTVAISGAASVSEGSLYSLTLGAVTDPGIDTITNYRVHWGDGSFDDYATAGVKTHTYADGPSTRVITVDLTDEDGTFTDAANALSVSVTNVAPTIAISGAASVSEGSLYSLTLGAVTDPGIDTITNYRVHWGDGSFDDYATAGVKTHTYADGPSTRVITVDLTDEDGTFTDAANALSVSVTNVAPTIAISGAASVSEGSLYSLTLGAVTDPGIDTITNYRVHWGDGSFDDYATAGVKTHTYADGPSTRVITVDLTDEDGTFTDAANALSVSVTNVAPTVGTVTVTFDPLTHVATATASFTDPGILDTHTAPVTWNVAGSGATVTFTESLGNGSVTGKITLPTGCYPTLMATITVTDKDSGVGSNFGLLTGAADAYAANFQSPIQDNERNIAKYGNVVPIKVSLTSSCTGASVPNATLYVTLTPGLNGEFIDDTNIVAESVSSADTGNIMRANGAGYIYNLTTKGLTQGKDYAVRIRTVSSTGPIVLQAVLQPKK